MSARRRRSGAALVPGTPCTPCTLDLVVDERASGTETLRHGQTTGIYGRSTRTPGVPCS
jgi:hypothetical protein